MTDPPYHKLILNLYYIFQDEDDKEDFNAAYAAPRMFLTFKSTSLTYLVHIKTLCLTWQKSIKIIYNR